MGILSVLIRYIGENGGCCALAEGAGGRLRDNLEQSGLSGLIDRYGVTVLDLDIEEAEQMDLDGQAHYLPKCLRNYAVRLAVPAASKRPEMVFSNNVKLFVGAVPKRFYQTGDTSVSWRPRVHLDLHKSVANIYRAIQSYAPFDLYINGGAAMDENRGEFRMDEVLVGSDGLELDLYVLEKYFNGHEIPDYLRRLRKESGA